MTQPKEPPVPDTPDLRAATRDVLDAIDSGCTPDEVRATAEWACGEAQRAA